MRGALPQPADHRRVAVWRAGWHDARAAGGTRCARQISSKTRLLCPRLAYRTTVPARTIASSPTTGRPRTPTRLRTLEIPGARRSQIVGAWAEFILTSVTSRRVVRHASTTPDAKRRDEDPPQSWPRAAQRSASRSGNDDGQTAQRPRIIGVWVATVDEVSGGGLGSITARGEPGAGA